MKKRWIAAGMLEAERSFRRVRHTDMAKLVDALRRESRQPLSHPKSTIRQQPEHAVATAALQQRTGQRPSERISRSLVRRPLRPTLARYPGPEA